MREASTTNMIVMRTRLLGIVASTTKGSATAQLAERTLFDLSNPFDTNPKGFSNLVQRVRAFVGKRERAVARRVEVMLGRAAMLQVVAALRVPAALLTPWVHARRDRRKARRQGRQRNRGLFRRFARSLP